MGLADLGLAAAAILVLAAFIDGCRRPRRLRWVIAAAFAILVANLALSSPAEDAPDSVLTGSVAVVSILFSLGLFTASVIAGVSARLVRSAFDS